MSDTFFFQLIDKLHELYDLYNHAYFKEFFLSNFVGIKLDYMCYLLFRFILPCFKSVAKVHSHRNFVIWENWLQSILGLSVLMQFLVLSLSK